MMTWKNFSVSAVFTFCALGAISAGAISIESRDFDALSAEADQIVIGTAVATSARRTGPREIVTDYRFNALEVVKGTVADSSLKLTMLGGTVGADSLTVAGAPTFQHGVRYLVFISGNGSVMFPLVGGQQGIFQVRKDAASGSSRMHDYAGRAVTRLPGRAGNAPEAHADARSGEAISVTVFVEAIRAKMGTRVEK